MTSPSPDRLTLLGLPVDALDMAGVLGRCEAFLAGGRSRQVVTANPLMLLAAGKDPGLRAALEGADLVVPDGAGLGLAAAFRGRRLPRVPGIDLMDALCARAAEKGWPVFFLGASPGTPEAAGRALAQRHPGLRVAGSRHGYFSSDEESGVVKEVSRAAPAILFVAMDSPRQDAWIHRNLSALGAGLAMGVGGSFDVLSGRLRRAPAWMRRAGMEWAFRLLQEPRRWRRMLGLPLFLLKVLASGRNTNP